MMVSNNTQNKCNMMWNDAKMTVPKYNGEIAWYLVYDSDIKTINIARIDSQGRWKYSGSLLDMSEYITHWMSLPKAPIIDR